MSTPTPPAVLPGMYYAVTAQDVTPDCPNYELSFDATEVYSNAGTLRVVCGLCGQDMQITAYSLLDPQPQVS